MKRNTKAGCGPGPGNIRAEPRDTASPRRARVPCRWQRGLSTRPSGAQHAFQAVSWFFSHSSGLLRALQGDQGALVDHGERGSLGEGCEAVRKRSRARPRGPSCWALQSPREVRSAGDRSLRHGWHGQLHAAWQVLTSFWPCCWM